MSEPIKTSTEAIPVVNVAIVGTGNGGTPLTTGTQATTPDHQPNLVLTVVRPIVALLIRFVNNYLTVLVGLISVGMVTKNVIPAVDFIHLVGKCASLSLASAAFGAIKDTLTIFGKLENKYPLATGSV